MKRGALLNSEISYEISKMGHTDGITIADCGLPIPSGVKRIDLALSKNLPGFIDTLEVILTELKIEEVIIAKEMKENSPALYDRVMEILKDQEAQEMGPIKLIEVEHGEFKALTTDTRAVIRTGEQTPYANIILKSGVVF
ncbi:D-ribose pyranase [Alkaliphilus crotonatoxidans]